MNIDNIKKYVCRGYQQNHSKNDFRKQYMFGPMLLVVMCGIVPGIVLKGYWLLLTSVMLLITAIGAVFTFVLSYGNITLEAYLRLKSLLYLAWVIDISLLELMYFSLWQGFNIIFFFMYVPVIAIPILLGLRMHNIIKRKEPFSPSTTSRESIKASAFFTGILGMNFAAIFRNAEQSIAVIIVLICFTILNCLMAVGLLYFQKVYYRKKYNVTF